jgi:dTDP-4-amino-4,6-dideoxygalactose transaminase
MRLRRTAIALRYSTAFAELGNLVELPTVEEGVRSAWHLYPLRLASDARLCRNQLIDDLNELGIGTSVHFIPVHLSPHFREHRGFRGGEFPICEDAYSRLLSLPLYSAMSDREVERVVSAVTELVSSYAR